MKTITNKLKEYLHKYELFQVLLNKMSEEHKNVEGLSFQQAAYLPEDEMMEWVTLTAKRDLVMADINYISPVISELYTMYMLQENIEDPLLEKEMVLAKKISKALGKRNFAVNGYEIVSINNELENKEIQDAIRARFSRAFQRFREQTKS